VNVIICTVRSQLRDCQQGNTRNHKGDLTAIKDPEFVLNSITAFTDIDSALTSFKGWLVAIFIFVTTFLINLLSAPASGLSGSSASVKYRKPLPVLHPRSWLPVLISTFTRTPSVWLWQ